jgi:hypothetical protein
MNSPAATPLAINEMQKSEDTAPEAEGVCSDLKTINLSKYYTEFPNEDAQLTKLDEAYRFMEIEVQKNIDHLKELESEIASIKENCAKSESKKA